MSKLFAKKDVNAKQLKIRQKLIRGRSVVGIDVGSSSINVAQMVHYRGKLTLVRTRIVDIDKNFDETQDQATLRALHTALEDFDKGSVSYACVINCPETCVRKVITPYMPKEDLRGAVELEAKRSIPFPLAEAVWDFNVIEDVVDKGVEKLSIIVAAAPKIVVDRLLSFFTPQKEKPFSGTISKKFDSQNQISPLGLKIKALLPLALCLENIIERSKLKTDETLVTIEMGTVVTELNIYKNSRLQFSRKIPFSGVDITKSLTGALMTEKGKVELTLQEAEKIKRDVGIPKIEENKEIDGKITSNHVLSLIRPKVEQLANEIERSFNFYREEMRGGKVDRLVLFGGGAQLKGLPEFLSKELDLEVEMGSFLSDINLFSEDVIEHEQSAHKLVLAIGAALSSMKGINLLPVETIEKRNRSIKKIAISFSTTAVVVLLLATFIPLQFKVSILKSELLQENQRINELYPQLQKIKEQVVIDQLVHSHPLWDEALKEMSHAIPTNVYLQRIKMDDNVLTINGTIEKGLEPSESTLSKFMVDLENSLFHNVRLATTNKGANTLDDLNFQITCKVER